MDKSTLLTRAAVIDWPQAYQTDCDQSSLGYIQ